MIIIEDQRGVLMSEVILVLVQVLIILISFLKHTSFQKAHFNAFLKFVLGRYQRLPIQ